MSRFTPNVPPPGGRPAADASSRGSVLIFVIGVLLLLAIVATAFLGSSRSDRTAVQQNAFNTQVDLLLDGVVHAAEGQITGDETVPGGGTAEPWDAVTRSDPVTGAALAPNDDWLASRVPTTFDISAVYNAGGTPQLNGVQAGASFPNLPSLNPSWWPAVSTPVLGATFESPYAPTGGYAGGLTYSTRERMVPTYVTFGGKRWPAFLVDTAQAPTSNATAATRFQTFLAADTDGDGVADAGLFRIPVGDLAGVTYFGAVRIVDNCAAVNVATSLSRDYEFDGAGAGGLVTATNVAGSFPSNVGLAEMLRSALTSTANNQLPTMAASAGGFENMSNSTAKTPEFANLSHYRFNITTAAVRLSGVSGIGAGYDASPYDDTTLSSGAYGRRLDSTGTFPEFQYASVGDAMTRVLGERGSNPGVARYTATTTAIARSLAGDATTLAARFVLGGPNEIIPYASFSASVPSPTSPGSLTNALNLSLDYGPNLTPTPTTPYDGMNSANGIDTWFQQNFDYLSELPTNPYTTAMNRRSILTTLSGTGMQTTTTVLPPDYLYNAQAGQWTGTSAAATVPLTAHRTLAAYPEYLPPNSTTPTPFVPMAVASLTNVSTLPARTIDPKVSINTGRFEELFYGYFKTMARSGFNGFANDVGTPFSTFYNGNLDTVNSGTAPAANSAQSARSYAKFSATTTGPYSQDAVTSGDGQYYSDPYIGMRFTPDLTTVAFPDRVEPSVEDSAGTKRALSVVNGQGAGTVEQNPLRMFRSVLRAAHNRTTAYDPTQDNDGDGSADGYWNHSTPRLPADQVLILRSAIAAANLEALRDSSSAPGAADPTISANDRIVPHYVPLTARGITGANAAVPVVARVYGLKRQPYITEVYINTGVTVDTTNLPGRENPHGYVAVKLYNPYNVAISLQYCRLVGLPRVRDDALSQGAVNAGYRVAVASQYPNMTVNPLVSPLGQLAAATATTDQIDLGTAVSNLTGSTYLGYVIPPNGTLVLENFPSSYTAGGADTRTLLDDAQHRPASSGLDATGQPHAAPAPDPTSVNFAYVPGLARVCLDRELVLMRPTNCTPPSAAAVPANTLVYTNSDGGTAATHPTIGDMAPLDSYDFTGLQVPASAGVTPTPVRTRQEAWYYSRTLTNHKWVYPGRYDANQSIASATLPAGIGPGPRQQGTVRALNSAGEPGWEINNAPGDLDPFAPTDTAYSHNSAKPVLPEFYKTVANTTVVARYPDVFTIQLNSVDWPGDQKLHVPTAALPNLYPYGGFRRLGDMLEAPFFGSYVIQTEPNAANSNTAINSGASVTTVILEANATTTDSALAEDTDPNDNENANGTTDNGSQSREQIGRLIPLRPTQGGGSGYTNGTPAVYTADPSGTTNPLQYSYMYDPAFDSRTTSSTTPDPLRYNDELMDAEATAIDAQQLPINTALNAQQISQLARTTRYQFANSLFENFTIASPHDDYLPNYPTQPKWQARTQYSIGDTVQYGMNIFVCKAAHMSSPESNYGVANADISPGSPAIDTTPLITPGTSSSWVPLTRTPMTNASATAGSRSDLGGKPPGGGPSISGTLARSYDYDVNDDANETLQPRVGMINLNTAPERVLAALPWSLRKGATGSDSLRFTFNNSGEPVSVTSGADGIDDNLQIAHAIALYRDGNYSVTSAGMTTNALGLAANPGRTFAHAATPFTSLYDLYKVPGFREAQTAILGAADPGRAEGDFSPASGAGDGVRYDFEEQSLLMNRVSNLATVRSDVFTLYAIVQGWRNVGTSNPQLVVQRRAAFIIDRSPVTAGTTSASMVLTPVPVN